MLPRDIPIFPLRRALLLPRGRLPLNIFEPRYLNLVDEALAGGRMFGMIQPRRAAVTDGVAGAGMDGETDEGAAGDADMDPDPDEAALHAVGCLGRLSSFAETEDGCYVITLTGLSRFRVAEELPLRRGFRSVRADYASFSDLGAAPPLVFDREGLIATLKAFFAARGFDANWEAISDLDNEMLVTTLSMVCPFAEAEKQALLEAPDTVSRAERLRALLAIGTHETDGDTRHAS